MRHGGGLPASGATSLAGGRAAGGARDGWERVWGLRGTRSFGAVWGHPPSAPGPDVAILSVHERECPQCALAAAVGEASTATSRLHSQRRGERREHEEKGGVARDRPRHLKKWGRRYWHTDGLQRMEPPSGDLTMPRLALDRYYARHRRRRAAGREEKGPIHDVSVMFGPRVTITRGAAPDGRCSYIPGDVARARLRTAG